MIELTDREKSGTFLALLRAWQVAPELATSQDVARHTTAKVIGLHLDDAAPIFAAATVLKLAREAMIAAGAQHKYWAVDMAALVALVGSEQGAVLAAGCAGFWASKASDGAVEWSDCASVGGPRNLIDVAEFGGCSDA
ncbi:hypothetical protein [Roseivivax sp. THAF30]|uniref:hypothetical protein n=1 Tax=Roseivivax sp. THAF30 TaxID=2587852 RepID=UPI001268EA99|nr:hypothetical protein [Roseivivax sp. THAF30]